jgi:hypothetical protein
MRTCLRSRPITLRVPRRGVETSTKLGPHRWVVESFLAAWPAPAARHSATNALSGCSPYFHPRRDADLLQEAHDVRQALILQRHFSDVPGPIA